jgi:hypothetical protein
MRKMFRSSAAQMSTRQRAFSISGSQLTKPKTMPLNGGSPTRAYRRWWYETRWRKAMTKARRKDGKLTGVTIEAADAIDAAKLPCTELRHCYRGGVQYVMFILRTAYEKATPGQPEYVAMAKSVEGWRFGGGTFPNRPLGETAVILTESDERRYKPDLQR